MEYIYAFMQMVGKYGPIFSIAAISMLAAISLTAYYLKTKIELMRHETTSRENERLAEVQARERERQALVSELGATRAQQHTFMTNHLEHDRQGREEIIKAMQEQVLTLRTMSEDLKSHRVEESARSAQFHEKLNEIHLEIRGKHE